MNNALAIHPPEPQAADRQAELIALVLDGVTSVHSRRSYRTGLQQLFAWIPREAPTFSRALVQAYRAHLLGVGLSSATLNLRLSPLRKLAREMADNGRLDPAGAAAMERVPGVARRGTRARELAGSGPGERAAQRSECKIPDWLAGPRDLGLTARLWPAPSGAAAAGRRRSVATRGPLGLR